MPAAPGVRIWVALALLVALVAALVAANARPPAPRPASAPPGEFSEARALPIVEKLAGVIGHRVAGTPGQEAAAAYLAGELGKLPGVEVAIQDFENVEPWPIQPEITVAYRVRNVLARIAGRSPEAVLLSAHYDTPWESAGAADDGLSVAVAVEVARALASSAPPDHTIILCLNGGEEAGLLGAAAFVRHPWARSVRAFINLEGMPKGKAMVFQAGPGNLWLMEAYARAAPHPYGSVWLQDLFQSGLFPNDTDFHAYRDLGKLRGLDFSTTDDAWAYHTALDRPRRLEAGSLQHMGDNTLAVVRELARSPLPGDVSPSPAVYYDLVGRVMVVYSAATARRLTQVGLGLTLLALALAIRRRRTSIGSIAAGTMMALVGALAGLAGAALAAALVALVLKRPGTWFASPWSAFVAYGSAALTGVLGAHAWWERRSARRGATAEARSLAAWAGAQICWCLLCAAGTLGGAGSAYLALWWVVPGALGLALAAYQPRAWAAALALALVPGAILLGEPASFIGRLLVPQSWSLGDGRPFELALALAIALPVVLAAWVCLAAIHRAGRLGRATVVVALFSALALTWMATRFPFTPERPKRVYAAHSGTELGVASFGALGLGPFLDGYSAPAGDPVMVLPGLDAELQSRVAPSGQAITVERLDSTVDPISRERSITVRLTAAGAGEIDLLVPRERLSGWSLAPSLPAIDPAARRYALIVFAPPKDGFTLTLRVAGQAPLVVETRALFPDAQTPAIAALRGRLPPWTTLAGVVLERAFPTL